MSYLPCYAESYEKGLLREKVERGLELLARCTLCPRNCAVDRLHGQWGVCRVVRYARVASYHPHLGEEDCLRGWNGSGTIFFSFCNLRCVFCQNFDISWQGVGREVRPQELARMMLRLQEMGCHNINLVTPEHVVPQILEALLIAVARGLRLPLVYNTSAYDGPESLELMDGVVDIYMPDFKYWDPARARRYLRAPSYPETARHAIKEMHRQAGDLTFDRHGLALRGVLVRHLVMPGEVEDSTQIMRWLSTEVSPNTYVNIMDQYRPAWKVSSTQFPELNRPITAAEYLAVEAAAREAGLHRFDRRRYFLLRAGV